MTLVYGLMKPMIQYGATTLYPGEPPLVWQREPQTREAYRHVSASGKTLTYYVGPRNFIEVTIPYQSDTLRAEWLSFWQAVRDGSDFYYSEADDFSKCGDGTKCGDGSKCGCDSNGDPITTTRVTLEQDDLAPEPSPEVWGYWDINLSMREYV